MTNIITKIKLVLFLSFCLLPTTNASEKIILEEKDPFEGMNRAIFDFNFTADKYLLKPVATAYDYITPGFIQTGLANFLSNLKEFTYSVNYILQGEGRLFSESITRFSVNTTFGILGLLDVAGEIGIKSKPTDFGETFAIYGVDSGPYVVLPFYGPNTLRSSIGIPYATVASIPSHIGGDNFGTYVTIAGVITKRAELLNADELIKLAAVDPYVYVRTTYYNSRKKFLEIQSSEEEEEDLLDAILDDPYEDEDDSVGR